MVIPLTPQIIYKAVQINKPQNLLDGIVELDDTYLGAPTHGKKRGRGTEIGQADRSFIKERSRKSRVR